MISTKVKTLVVVFVLLFSTSIVAVGCKRKPSHGLMNTDTLPGKALSKYAKSYNARRSNSNIVYLGADSDTSGENFGPKDISFEFQTLR